MNTMFKSTCLTLVVLANSMAWGQTPKPVKSRDHLLSLLRSSAPRYSFFAPVAQPMMAQSISVRDASFTAPNVRTPGVDEADIIKTDGHYIYQLTGDRLIITRAQPASELSITGIIEFADTHFYPQELYVDGDRLAVIGSDWGEPIYPMARMSTSFFMRGTVKVRVYDMEDRSAPKLLREVEVTGTHLASRKIGDHIYLISRKYPDYYSFLPVNREVARQRLLPKVRETRSLRGHAIGKRNTFRNMHLSRIYYFPGFEEPVYLVLTAFSMKNEQAPARHLAYLGAGDIVYASRSNLYLSVSQYPKQDDSSGSGTAASEETMIHKFSLAGQTVKHEASGIVPGRVLNEFSMDEHDGLFRIATTRTTWEPQPTQHNGVYVLDESMNTIGSLEGLAPGESIFSARFSGDRAYLVTFRLVDPFFVIDLSEPTAPSVLGELKIPGFSTYLHPYDANHVIGIGQDTTVITDPPADMPWMENMVFTMGMKVTMFDVQDVNNPVEKSTLLIGDRGTYSEALWNHKAVLFDRDERLLAFPVSIHEVEPGTDPTLPWNYGHPVFNGAAILDVGLDTGITYVDGITHIDDAVSSWWQFDRQIRRLFRMNQAIYTVSDSMIMAHDENSLEEISRLVTGTPVQAPWFFPVMQAADTFSDGVMENANAPVD